MFAIKGVAKREAPNPLGLGVLDKAGFCCLFAKTLPMAKIVERRPTQREALEAAKLAMEAQGHAMSAFAVATNERVVAGEITTEEAIALIVAHYGLQRET
jgi:hypothetical protein